MISRAPLGPKKCETNSRRKRVPLLRSGEMFEIIASTTTEGIHYQSNSSFLLSSALGCGESIVPALEWVFIFSRLEGWPRSLNERVFVKVCQSLG